MSAQFRVDNPNISILQKKGSRKMAFESKDGVVHPPTDEIGDYERFEIPWPDVKKVLIDYLEGL